MDCLLPASTAINELQPASVAKHSPASSDTSSRDPMLLLDASDLCTLFSICGPQGRAAGLAEAGELGQWHSRHHVICHHGQSDGH